MVQQDYIIEFKGKKYQLDKEYWKNTMVNDSLDFQYQQLQYCLETQDFTTLQNRIASMIKWGGINEIE